MDQARGSEPAGKKLPLLPNLLLQWSSAALSAGLVAPFIYIVDKSIIANASGKQPLFQGIAQGVRTLFSRPAEILKNVGFRWVFFVYSGTYIVSNSIETACYYLDQSSFMPKFLGNSVANISLSMLKDRVLTIMHGAGNPRPLHPLSFLCFGARDSMTILASFNLPDMMSGSFLQARLGMSKYSADVTAQLITPIGMQVFSCPLHLYGIDLYNRPEPVQPTRWQFIKREYTKTLIARQMRILPSFGIAGVANKSLRKHGVEYLESRYC